ncbi:MAG TPA: ATP-binding protein [Candidatus Xenobia bacterium]
MSTGRLLIVDDEIELMNALREALGHHGYDVVGLSSGEKALELLRHEHFDLLLSDLMMPEMDGISLLHAALQIDSRLVGVIMTGQGTLQTAVDAMKTGAYDYILKPFKLNALLPTLARAIEVRRLRAENVDLRESLAVHEVSKLISTTLDPKRLLETMADAAMRQFEADELSILDADLRVVEVRPWSRHDLLGEKANGPAAWAPEPRLLSGEIDTPYQRTDLRSSMIVPMMVAGRCVGMLCLGATTRRPFGPADLKALGTLAGTAASAFENAALYQRVRDAEAKYRSIIENAVEGIFQTTPDGRLVTANPALARLFGYPTPEDMLGKVTDLSRQVYVDGSRRAVLQQLLTLNNHVTNFEAEVIRQDGVRIWISENTRAVKNDDGSIRYYEGMLMDVTERRKSQEALEETNLRLAEALEALQQAQQRLVQQERLRALGEMASGVAHDFNNALSAILGFTETMLLFPDDLTDEDKVRECLTIIDTIARDATGLVGRLRSFYRPLSKDEDRSAVDLSALVSQTATMTQPRWKGSARGVHLLTDVAAVPKVLGNEGELRQVFTNLIFNAVDAMPEGGTITLRVQPTGSGVEVEVRDTGMGMSEETLARCLEPFYTTKGEKGTGLGLAMVYGAVQRHGGTLSFKTAPGQGTTVKLRFPHVG